MTATIIPFPNRRWAAEDDAIRQKTDSERRVAILVEYIEEEIAKDPAKWERRMRKNRD